MPTTDLDPMQLTREQVLRALRQLDREGPRMPLSTVYDLVYRGRRYAPRAVAQLAFRLALGQPEAAWPLAAGAPTNRVLERLDFTIATKRPTLANSTHDGDVAAQQDMQALYVGPEAPKKKAWLYCRASCLRSPRARGSLRAAHGTLWPRAGAAGAVYF